MSATWKFGVSLVTGTCLLLGALIAWGEAAPVDVPDIVQLTLSNLTFTYPGDAGAAPLAPTPPLTVTINGSFFWDNRIGRPAVGSLYTDHYDSSVWGYRAIWQGGIESGSVIGHGGNALDPGSEFRSGAFLVEFEHPHQPYSATVSVVFPVVSNPDYDPARFCCWPPAFLVPGEAPIDADFMGLFTGDGVVIRPTSGTQTITTPEPATLALLALGLGSVGLGALVRRR